MLKENYINGPDSFNVFVGLLHRIKQLLERHMKSPSDRLDTNQELSYVSLAAELTSTLDYRQTPWMTSSVSQGDILFEAMGRSKLFTSSSLCILTKSVGYNLLFPSTVWEWLRTRKETYWIVIEHFMHDSDVLKRFEFRPHRAFSSSSSVICAVGAQNLLISCISIIHNPILEYVRKSALQKDYTWSPLAGRQRFMF